MIGSIARVKKPSGPLIQVMVNKNINAHRFTLKIAIVTIIITINNGIRKINSITPKIPSIFPISPALTPSYPNFSTKIITPRRITVRILLKQNNKVTCQGGWDFKSVEVIFSTPLIHYLLCL